MRFVIEQRHIADMGGKPLSGGTLSFFTLDADTAEAAATSFAADHSAEMLGNVRTFPGFQAIATMRTGSGVYTLQVMPASQQFVTP